MQRDDFTDAVASYRERFSDSPPAYVFFGPLDLDNAVEQMQRAIATGEKLPAETVADDVVI